MKMFKTLREENELIMKLKGFCPGNKIPRGILMQGPEALKTGKYYSILFNSIQFSLLNNNLFTKLLAFERYKNAKQLDSVNEKRPTSYK